MTLYKPAAHSNSIVRPNCTKCGIATLVFGIESADRPGYDLHTFECPNCKNIEEGRVETAIVAASFLYEYADAMSAIGIAAANVRFRA